MIPEQQAAVLKLGKDPLLAHQALLQLLDYDPETGIFRWKVDRQYNALKGQIAGKKTKRGYWCITVAGRDYRGHRLAWFYIHGEWPAGQIDHINRVRTDNRIANLRVATQSQNSANMWRAKSNTSGYKGVYWHKRAKKWAAEVKKSGKKYYLGLFESIEQAHLAHVAKARELFGEFAS